MDFDQTLYIVIPSPTKLRRGYSNASVHPSVKFLVNTLRVNMVQWISTKLGTQVILTEIWHPIDFQGQMSRSQLNFEFFRGLTVRGYAMLCVVLVFLEVEKSLLKWSREMANHMIFPFVASTNLCRSFCTPQDYIGSDILLCYFIK